MTCQNPNQPWVKTIQFTQKDWDFYWSYASEVSKDHIREWSVHWKETQAGTSLLKQCLSHENPLCALFQEPAIHQGPTVLYVMSQYLSTTFNAFCTCAIAVSSECLVTSALLGCSQKCSFFWKFDFYIKMDSNFIHI